MTQSASLVRVGPATILRLAPLGKEMERASLTGQEDRTGFLVRAVRGRAEFSSVDGKWELLKVDSVLAQGTRVRTRGTAIVDLFNAEHSRVIRVLDDSEVVLGAVPVATAGKILSNRALSETFAQK